MKIEYWIIGGLGLVIAALILFDKDPEPDTSIKDAQIAQRDTLIHQLSREAEKEKRERKAERLAYMDTVRTYKDRDKKRVAYIARIKVNPVVVKVREEVPIIDSAFHAYDSLLQSKDDQISHAEKRIDKLEMDIKEVEERFEKQLGLMAENVTDLKAITDDQRKQLRKIRRQNRIVKVIAVVGTVASFIGGSQL